MWNAAVDLQHQRAGRRRSPHSQSVQRLGPPESSRRRCLTRGRRSPPARHIRRDVQLGHATAPPRRCRSSDARTGLGPRAAACMRRDPRPSSRPGVVSRCWTDRGDDACWPVRRRRAGRPRSAAPPARDGSRHAGRGDRAAARQVPPGADEPHPGRPSCSITLARRAIEHGHLVPVPAGAARASSRGGAGPPSMLAGPACRTAEPDPAAAGVQRAGRGADRRVGRALDPAVAPRPGCAAIGTGPTPAGRAAGAGVIRSAPRGLAASRAGCPGQVPRPRGCSTAPPSPGSWRGRAGAFVAQPRPRPGQCGPASGLAHAGPHDPASVAA